MATASTLSPEHTVWDCRWSRPGHRLTGVSDRLQPESVWVCVHDDGRRPVSNEECAICARWEASSAAVAPVAMRASPMRMLAEGPAIAVHPLFVPDAETLVQAGLRVVLVLMALGFVALGLTILTRPLAIPFTIGLWMVAAVLGTLAVVTPRASS
jgi:hypothetical protein